MPRPKIIGKRLKSKSFDKTISNSISKRIKMGGSEPQGVSIAINNIGCRFGGNSGKVKELKTEISELKLQIQRLESKQGQLPHDILVKSF
jgi:hypothetical protein